MRTRVKICGCVDPADAALAVRAGADAVGVILSERSPRRVAIDRAREIAAELPAFCTLVAVFTDPPASLVDEALRFGAVPQFHGDEPAEVCDAFAEGPYLKALHVGASTSAEELERAAERYPRATILLDTAVAGRSGGTGTTFAWDRARALAARRPVVVSGGLTPENVGACVRMLRPYAVDVRSGVEVGGVKDPARIQAFVQAVRDADA